MELYPAAPWKTLAIPALILAASPPPSPFLSAHARVENSARRYSSLRELCGDDGRVCREGPAVREKDTQRGEGGEWNSDGSADLGVFHLFFSRLKKFRIPILASAFVCRVNYFATWTAIFGSSSPFCQHHHEVLQALRGNKMSSDTQSISWIFGTEKCCVEDEKNLKLFTLAPRRSDCYT